MQRKKASLQAARAARGRKRKHAKERNEILCNNLSLPKRRRDDKSFADDFRRIVDFHLLIRELKNGCHYCRQKPLLLSERILQDQRSQSPDKIQIMCQSCKRLSHVSINNSTEINERFVLACLHTRTGHSHLDSYLNIVGLSSISNQKSKAWKEKLAKKCNDYGTKNTYCRTCQQSMRMGNRKMYRIVVRTTAEVLKLCMEACFSEEL